MKADGGAISKASLGVSDREQLLVAGSTHPGEEEAIVTAYQSLSAEWPISCWCWRLAILSGRRRSSRWCEAEDSRSHDAVSAKQGQMAGSGPRVSILDTRGELALLYRDAVVAFVGGTLVPIGGHNLLEPAVWGKPVFFRPAY